MYLKINIMVKKEENIIIDGIMEETVVTDISVWGDRISNNMYI